MRIALIAPPWIPVPPTTYGGTEAVIDTLARGLASAGHQVLLAATGDSTCPVERTWVYEHARTDDMDDTAVELRHLLHAYAAADGADIVHDHTLAGAVYGSLLPGRTIVTTNHWLFSDDINAIYRSIARRVAVVAISRHQASTAGGVPVAGVIPHGVDVDRYLLGEGGDFLLFLGRMSPTKGVSDAIDIARRAGEPLVIAAKLRSPAEHAYFDTVIEPRLGGDVTYVGEVGGEEKRELLGGARALLNPVRWPEPFGLCMVEALASGTPVIARRRGAAPEIVDDGVTGFLCTDNRDMAAAVARVDTIDRRACCAAVINRFSARRMVADHVALYQDVLAANVKHAVASGPTAA